MIFFGEALLDRSAGGIRARAGGRATATADRIEAGFRLRPAEPGDFPFALALYLACAREHLTKIGRWDEDRFVALFHDGYKPAQARFISVDGRVVGFIQVVDFADRLYLRQLHLIEGFRRRGIGSALIGAELERGVESGRPVTLDVMHGNPAKQLYLRLGFAVTGHDPDKEQMIWRAPPRSEPAPRAPSEPQD